MPGGCFPSARRVAALSAVLVVFSALSVAVGAPPGTAAGAGATIDGPVYPAADYWTETFSNPLDFDDAADITVSGEGPMAGLSDVSVAGGFLRFSMPDRGGGPAPGYFSPVWGGYGPSAPQGREGSLRKIDTERFTTLVLRMNASAQTDAGVRWYTCRSGVADNCQGGFPFTILPGWHTYTFTLSVAALRNGDPALRQPWDGMVTGIRLALSPSTATAYEVDWIRLLSAPEANGNSGSDGVTRGPAPEVLNPDAAGAIPVVLDANGSVMTRVDASPCSDYATRARGGDAWDFDQPSDIGALENIVSATTENGVLHGTSAPSADGVRPGDPGIRLPTPVPIDPTRYRHATVVMPQTSGSYSQRAGPGGAWLVRFLWKFADRPGAWEVTRELPHYPEQRVISVDLADARTFDGVAAAAADISDSEKGGIGWSVPGKAVTTFRVDPHEDYASREFWIDQVWLAEDDCGGDAFTVLFRDRNWAPGTKADIRIDTDGQGFDGALVARDIDVKDGINAFRWTGARPGRWWVYVVMHRDAMDGRAYGTGPVRISGAAPSSAGKASTRRAATTKRAG